MSSKSKTDGIYLEIDGRLVGYIVSVQWTKSVAPAAVEVLDDVLVTEHVTGGVSYTLSMEAMDVMGITVPPGDARRSLSANFTTPARAKGGDVK